MSAIEEQAKAAAKRVDSEQVGIDPITIITIITQVLPLLISCWNRNDEPNAEETRASLQKYNDRHPKELLRRTARRVRAEADRPMTKDQSFALAQAIIDQALSTDEDTVVSCCLEAE